MSKQLLVFIFVFYVITSILDLISTLIFLEFGISTEANPIVRTVLNNGYGALILLKFFGILFVAAMMVRTPTKPVFAAMVMTCGISVAVVIFNVRVILIGVGLLG